MRLKIGLVFDDSLDRPDGVQQQITLLAKWLAQQGHAVSVLCGETKITTIPGVTIYSLSKNVTISANQNRLSLPRPTSSGRIKEIFNQQQFDVIHVMLPFSPWLGARVIDEALKRHIPLLGTWHTYPANTLQRWGSRLYGLLIQSRLKRFSIISSVSEPTRLSVAKLFKIDSVVIPNFIELARFKHTRPANQTLPTKHIVFLNRLVKRKGPQHLIEAVIELHNQKALKNIIVKIGGRGPLEGQLKTRVAQAGLSQAVEFSGFVAEEAKVEYLAQADLAVYPATGGEAFGIVLLEGMATGAVVLGGDNPGYRSVLSGQPILLIDPTNHQAFAQRLIELLNNLPLRQNLVRWQAEQVKQYDVAVVGRRWVELYRSALAL